MRNTDVVFYKRADNADMREPSRRATAEIESNSTHTKSGNLFDEVNFLLLSPYMQYRADYHRTTRRAGQKRWQAYILSSMLVIAVAFVLQFVLRYLFFFPQRVTVDSMTPEISTGDKRYFIYPKLTKVGLGDVVLVKAAHADVEYLCRVAALDGDKVQITEGKFWVNGVVKKQLKARLAITEDRSFQMAVVEVRPNYFFCLNDNAQNTNDSRTHGPFERSQIIGKVFKPTLFF